MSYYSLQQSRLQRRKMAFRRYLCHSAFAVIPSAARNRSEAEFGAANLPPSRPTFGRAVAGDFSAPDAHAPRTPDGMAGMGAIQFFLIPNELLR
ncbi:MAG: hypothetical protein LBB79_03720, partial [Prevotellaceae bacterium]|nr:hypothetical protein [Prevotellaceae bacterium]